ncbi:MAG: threonine synthase [Xanthomonadales bacterium]|nr:threonine synthase [Xanthomonadales bacterium]NIN58920.1 threonine synthase [Xanthomonadales bacterium]NIN74189.1 threonine synthase [Xanthomonadales bacterium]NIO13860.1 threonine synthase [Xanthomonadales bacterium]NIP11313.1 threonine synthase [Xanthomonadales bacterium]
MNFYNIAHPAQRLSFPEAVRLGIGREQGLFMPLRLAPLADVQALLELEFVPRSAAILDHIIAGDVETGVLGGLVERAFDFPVPLRAVAAGVHALELFHGTSLAFKDFGARFLAQCLQRFRGEGPMTILTATSGDTGAAVAQAFYGQQGVQVVILYPRGRVTPLQEKLFCTLGGNVRTYAVEDDFDACQAMVKQAFLDRQLVEALGLNSANSINIARLLAQVCYYFEAVACLPAGTRPVFSVPSGNFGNVTAALIACAIGLPARRVIAATNANDTVPRFLASGRWDPHATVATMTSAMDISQPNNFSRVQALEADHGLPLSELLRAVALSDQQTAGAIRALYAQGYLADPHSALGWSALEVCRQAEETGVFLCTAHPAKFREDLEAVLGIEVPLPPALRAVADRPLLSEVISSEFSAFRPLLMAAGQGVA